MPELLLALLAAWVWYGRSLRHLPTKTRTYLVLTIALAACVVTAL